MHLSEMLPYFVRTHSVQYIYVSLCVLLFLLLGVTVYETSMLACVRCYFFFGTHVIQNIYVSLYVLLFCWDSAYTRHLC